MRPITTVSLSITDRCNLQCSHCTQSGSQKRFGNSAEPTLSELSILFRSLAAAGTTSMVISGGEPLLRKDLVDILQCAAVNNITCGLLTNGTLLTRTKVRQLKSTGALDFIRLSVEYPIGYERSKRSGNHGHSAETALAALDQCVGAGVTAGVNMTLMSDNRVFAPELAATFSNHGAQFIRMVPVLPFTREQCSTVNIPFIISCVDTLVRLHQIYGTSADGDSGKIHRRQLVESFVKPCGSGQTSLTISTDGSVKICPMLDCGEHPCSVYSDSLDRCVAYINARRRYLQRRITANTTACSTCTSRITCRGGCIAEWFTRGRPDGQPVCYKAIINGFLNKADKRNEALQAIAHLSSDIDLNYLFGGCYPCLRGLPLWTIYFSGDRNGLQKAEAV